MISTSPSFLVLACVSLLACERAPDDLREWTASDHDQPTQAMPTSSASQEGAGLIELAWQRHCYSCHGPDGRGNGPQGPMVQAPDLTRSAASDQQMTETIRKGRNRMPAFDLPDSIVSGLIARIRTHQNKAK